MTGSPLIVALDHTDPGDAWRCVEAVGPAVERFKVGSVLFTRAGPDFVRRMVTSGRSIFLDLKFHDTPATVAGAVVAAADLGADLLTLHAAGGRAMMEAARRAADGAGRSPRLLAVTVLTSLGEDEYARVQGPGARPLREAVDVQARLAIEAGIDGLVCGAGEAADLRRALGPEPLLVVPGIRPVWSTSEHSGQARTATPVEALSAGATYLVLGRAVTEAEDPAAAVARIEAEIAA